MEFEELQVIWNTQNQQPLYAINEAAVQAAMWQKRQVSRRTWFRWVVATGLLAAAVITGLLVLVSIDTAAFTWLIKTRLVAAGALLLGFVAILARDWLQEKRREGPFSGSLREELDRSIAHLEYQIRSGGGKTVCMMATPLCVAASLVMWALTDLTGASPWLLAVVVGAMLSGFPVEIWRHHRRVTRDLLPRMQTLESLRAKLANPPS
jgi:hypothetical protein